MIFVTNKILVNEIERLRADNMALKETIVELIDKFVHQKHPDRLIKPTVMSPDPFVIAETGMGDPVSVAEREAWEHSRPKEMFPKSVSGT